MGEANAGPGFRSSARGAQIVAAHRHAFHPKGQKPLESLRKSSQGIDMSERDPKPKPVTRRTLRKHATRVSVVEAAREIFRVQGYEGATIADIAKAADVSPGTVLNGSPTKIALLNAVMTEDFIALGADCETLRMSLTSTYRDKVAALLELHLQRHCQELELISAVLGHSWIDGGSQLDALYANLRTAWAPILAVTREHQAAGGVQAGVEPEEIIQLMQDMYIGVIRRCSQDANAQFAASTAMRRGLDLILDGVLA
jgi:AcrR family transcriptional regulator